MGKNYLESVVYMVKISKRGGTTIVKRVFIHGVDTVDLGWVVGGESMVDVAQRTYGLDRRSAPHGPWRRGLRSTIHFFSYHFILKRRTTTYLTYILRPPSPGRNMVCQVYTSIMPRVSKYKWWEILYRFAICHIYRRLSDGLFIKRYDF